MFDSSTFENTATTYITLETCGGMLTSIESERNDFDGMITTLVDLAAVNTASAQVEHAMSTSLATVAWELERTELGSDIAAGNRVSAVEALVHNAVHQADGVANCPPGLCNELQCPDTIEIGNINCSVDTSLPSETLARNVDMLHQFAEKTCEQRVEIAREQGDMGTFLNGPLPIVFAAALAVTIIATSVAGTISHIKSKP